VETVAAQAVRHREAHDGVEGAVLERERGAVALVHVDGRELCVQGACQRRGDLDRGQVAAVSG
jgi:hypothetical protein